MALFVVDKEMGRWRVARATKDGPNIASTSKSKTTAVKQARESAKNFREKYDGQVLLLVKSGDNSIARATKYRDGDEFVDASVMVGKQAVYPYLLSVLIENPAGFDEPTARFQIGHYMTKRAARDAVVEIGQ